MPMKLAQLKKLIQKEKKTLEEKYCVSAIYVFGSVATGKASKKSDVDLLIEFSSKSVGLFEFADLKFFLESLLKVKVDLVTRAAIKERMMARIEKESVRVA